MADNDNQTCAQCGATFSGRKRKYCNPKCNWLAASRRKGRRSLAEQRADEYKRTHRECIGCGIMFKKTRHDNHSHGTQFYCSNKCGQRARQNSARRELESLIRRERYVYQQWSWASQRRERERVRYHKPCQECGAKVTTYRAILCAECRDNRTRVCRRAARLARKARIRSVTVEQFDPVVVLTRDGWRCHICGIKTPKRLRGSYEDNAPELDHIIPLAQGGEHSRRNTACACRKCNIEKSDKPLGQLRMLA